MRGKINIANYEAWLLDQLEGRLSAEEEQELLNFLILHPELEGNDGNLSDIVHRHLQRFLIICT